MIKQQILSGNDFNPKKLKYIFNNRYYGYNCGIKLYSTMNIPLLCKLMDNDDFAIHSKLNHDIYQEYISDPARKTPIKILRHIKAPRCYMCKKKISINTLVLS